MVVIHTYIKLRVTWVNLFTLFTQPYSGTCSTSGKINVMDFSKLCVFFGLAAMLHAAYSATQRKINLNGCYMCDQSVINVEIV